MEATTSHRLSRLLIAAAAAFGTYFCMYAFRKPFTAGTFEGAEVFGLGLKSVLVISQLAGYMLSKFIGIKVVSEMRGERRAAALIGLILAAELALVGFAVAPVPLKVVMLFLNGLPLGIVFGLVLAYLEGRQQTEALSAALCASFIVASGVVKSVGRWIIQDLHVSEFQMPMWEGLLFLPPFLLSVWILQKTPPPDDTDRRLRTVRQVMNREERRRFLHSYWPGLTLLVFVYTALTVVRTVRDDFAVEIWRDLGVAKEPAVFARSETVVAVFVTAVNALVIWITHHLAAFRTMVGLMCAAFALVGCSAVVYSAGLTTPFGFMVACGVGLYVPYVAFHTTLFERLIAAARRPSNLGFLMYVADAIGYLGYAVVLVVRAAHPNPGPVLPFFHTTLIVVTVVSIGGLLTATYYFHKVLPREEDARSSETIVPPLEQLSTVDAGRTA